MKNEQIKGAFAGEAEAKNLLAKNLAKVNAEININLASWNRNNKKVKLVSKKVMYDNQVNWLYFSVKPEESGIAANRWYFFIDSSNKIWWDNKPSFQK